MAAKKSALLDKLRVAGGAFKRIARHFDTVARYVNTTARYANTAARYGQNV